MAETSLASDATPLPDSARIAAAEDFTREPFLFEGEDREAALAAGSARRRALDAALREIDAGLDVPSAKWRRRYSLMLGLERVLTEDEPRLADGTLLNPHQVDALSGTLVALIASLQVASDEEEHSSAAPVLAVDEDDSDDGAEEQPTDETDAVDPDDDEEDAPEHPGGVVNQALRLRPRQVADQIPGAADPGFQGAEPAGGVEIHFPIHLEISGGGGGIMSMRRPIS